MKFVLTLLCVVLAGIWIGCSSSPLAGDASSPSAATAADQQAAALPKDVHPDSLNRLPLVKREELDERRQKLYDEALAKGKSVEGLQGVGGILLHSSTTDVRYESPLGRRLTELAIIIGARESEQNFEWTLHVEEAMRQGLEMPIVDIVRHKKPAVGLGDKETAIITVGREMAQKHSVSPETFAFALKALGKENLVDMVSTMSRRANETPLIWVDQHLPLDWQEKAPMPIEIIKSPPDIFPMSRNRMRQMEGQARGTPGRTLAPYGTGPGQIGLHGAGGKFLEQNLGQRLLDLAALTTARELDQQVSWTLHEREALEHGLEPAIIDVVRLRKPLTGLPPREAAVIQIGRELIGKHKVTPETYVQGVGLFGERDALDLASEYEHHAEIDGILTVFNQQLPAGQKPLLPIP